ncbi:MAG: aspartyl/glutamyl-tRNA amidotransferase subunit [Pseudomonadota bacterium]|jgi:aspartyl-tRNA(Asn)/glutamyl-tRNA(Gln) amidotransferase subunit B
MIIQGAKGQYRVVIGLEVHAQVNTKTKLFSNSRNNFGDEQNTNVAFFDISLPGVLPALNGEVLKKTIKTGLALNAKINNVCRFDRKHYFYPDLPSGYQITQMHQPIVQNGWIEIKKEDGSLKKIRVNRIHIEQDAGKSIHSGSRSLMDYNRAGVPLMEIVSEPDISSAEEAVLYLKKLQQILRFVDSADADLEKGTFRCDVNVSVMPLDAKEFGTRCEIKNINSFRFIAQAIEFEANRHVEMIERGEPVVQQTRLFDQKKGVTMLMRDKADALDYRYMPDSNLLEVKILDSEIEQIKSEMPEMPDAVFDRYIGLGVSEKDAKFLTSDVVFVKYFDELHKKHDAKMCITWMLNELMGQLAGAGIAFADNKISVEMLVELMDLIKDGKINGKIGKEVLLEMINSNKRAGVIVEEKGLLQIDNDDEIKKVIEEVITENNTQFEQVLGGNQKLLAFFVGQVMKKTGGKANPASVNRILQDVVSGRGG